MAPFSQSCRFRAIQLPLSNFPVAVAAPNNGCPGRCIRLARRGLRNSSIFAYKVDPGAWHFAMMVHGTLRGKGNGRLRCWTTRCCSWDATRETVLRTLRVCPIRTGFERAKSLFQELKHDESSSNKCGISAPCHYYVCPGKNSGGRDDETCHDGR